MSSKPAHLEPSKLGTKEYWDNLYTTEISNHAHDPSDIGTVWFDDSDAQAKMVEYLENLAEEEAIDKTSTSFLDLGCGNGSMLLALCEEQWSGRMMGVDYSAQSVALAQQVAASTSWGQNVQFREWDVIAGPMEHVLEPTLPDEGWDVVLDKGTFDAISLSDEKDAQGRRLCEGYRSRVWQLARRGGIFLITSCNWTEEELRGWFEDKDEPGNPGFSLVGRVNYRTFSFGGAKGQTITTLCFRKATKNSSERPEV
ncbi:S-adenosyl-L-methionine-dependent methyltransferase [Stachybotrys elegans]|uniref:Protein-lysine N-methyltransferase EFM4 n=1 Tax=Stachybotrys elegans TaxID=80388 RepID=A0A8K0WQ40_9HYPO|nr:S-adenosyl-L-methionine-dependent methyltransferase [Stachybotrys elegans]